MADGVNIDWGLAQGAPDLAGNYINAFKVGQELGKQTATANAFSGPDPSPGAALKARLAGLDPSQRAWAGQQADLLASLGAGLKGLPYAERGAVLAHMTPALAARGVPPAAIAGFDPTDGNIDEAVTSAVSLGRALAASG